MGNRIETFRAMVEQDPANLHARFGLANELMKEHEHAEAAEHYRVYLDGYDDEGNGWLRYADALEHLGRQDEAAGALRKALDAANRFGHPGMADEIEERLRVVR
jgi:tetratricopeptide (TPR) repeat protein